MENLYLFQPNYGTGSGEFSTVWLPYSAGSIWSYARQNAAVADNYQLQGLYFKRTPIEDVLDGMEAPSVVGFSNYIWNSNYNRSMAEAIKVRWPAALIVFGGPEVPNRIEPFLRNNPAIDVAVHQEGEFAITRILEAHLEADSSWQQTPGISFIDTHGELVANPSSGRINDLSDISSPYLDGVFDDLIRENPGAQWASTLETNRGCPFKCHFCDWGSMLFSKVKQFPMERVLSELEWLADNRVEYVFLADANFGILKDRDQTIADNILRIVEDKGYPKTFCIQWTKNSNAGVVEMARQLSSVQKGLTLSVQSMTEEVLSAIERRNMAINNLAEILELANREQIPSYTELILGLPMETLESWKECFHRLLELGQHCAVDIWIAQVLQNSALADPEERARFGIETVLSKDYFFGARQAREGEADISEGIELIRSTKSMPFDDLIDCYMYAWMVMNFHLYGWTQLWSRFLHNSSVLTYKEFYGALFEYIRSGESPLALREHNITRRRISEYLTVGEIRGNLKDEIGLDLEIAGHNLMWLSQMTFRSSGRTLFDELRPFFVSMGTHLDLEMVNDLISAQEQALVFYGENYPKAFTVGFNIVECALHGEPVRRERCSYQADYRPEVRENVANLASLSLHDFLYLLYFKRRMSPGTTAIASLDASMQPVDTSLSTISAELVGTT